MRDYGKIRTTFWTDGRTAGLSDKAKLLACYLLSGPHSNSIGCFRLPLGYVAEDLKWPLETVTETVTETVSKGFIERCEKTSLVRICNWWKHNTIENSNVGKNAAVLIEALPQDSDVFTNFISSLEPLRERFAEGFLERFAKRSPKPSSDYSEKGMPTPEPKPEPIPTSSSLRSEGVPPPENQETMEAKVYRRGKEVLGKNAGGQISKLRKDRSDGQAMHLIEEAAKKQNPGEWIAKIINSGTEPEYVPLADRERKMWAPRVKGWPGTWVDQWGPPPDHPDTLVPMELRPEQRKEASG